MTRFAGSMLPTVLSLALFAALGCGGSAKGAETPAATEPPAEPEAAAAEQEAAPAEQQAAPAEQQAAPAEQQAAPVDLDAQLRQAKKVWAESCATCHGPKGEGKGKKSPAVVGSKALGKYKTGADLLAYVKAKMPKDDPGSLSESDYLAVTAWVIAYNGRLGEMNNPVTAESVAAIKLH